MKHFKSLAVAAFALLILVSCGDKKPKTNDAGNGSQPPAQEASATPTSKLEGSWEIIRATGDMSGMNVGTIYEFKGDKLNLKSPGFTNPGTTEVTNNTFSFQADGNELKFLYDYKIEGDTLVASMQKSNQTFYMAKK